MRRRRYPFEKFNGRSFAGIDTSLTRVYVLIHTPGGTKELLYNPARHLELLSTLPLFECNAKIVIHMREEHSNPIGFLGLKAIATMLLLNIPNCN